MRTILIIEDDPVERELIQDLLQAEGYTTFCAANGASGVELVQRRLPDLILCDVQMPDMDGYTVLKTLQCQAMTATIPFVFLTGLSAATNLRQGMTLGADDYLTKPVSPQELLRAIEQRFQRQAILRDQMQQPLDQLRYQIAQRIPTTLDCSIQEVLQLTEQLIQQYQHLDYSVIRRIAETIYTSTEQLSKAVQRFLIYIGLEVRAADPEQQAEVQQEYTDYPKPAIASVANQIAREMEREADLDLDLDNAAIRISDINLQRLMHEVVDNAFRYSPAGTPIVIRTEVAPAEFKIAVINQRASIAAGPIASPQQEQGLPNGFVDSRRGLGLLIIQRLVELHGGKLTIANQPDQRTIVELKLPLSNF
jgi:CheY-like chemotaxis protein/anti-sigma regulatory factor (Ser/Thr protein kinase)